MTKSLPKVSIPITSFNQEKFIEDAVISAVLQDYDNLQVVVCDDGSSDNSREILMDLKSKYTGRLDLCFNDKNIGLDGNRNLSFTLSDGYFISYLDGDDIFLPNKIKNQVDFMLSRPECVLSFHDVLVFDDVTKRELFRWNERFGQKVGSVEKLIQRGNYLCSLSTMFRKGDIPKEGFLKSLEGGADWIFFINLLVSSGGKYCYLDEVLAKYRRHTGNITLNWDKKLNSQYKGIELINEKYPQFKKYADQRYSDILFIDSIIKFRNRNYKEMIILIKKSFWLVFPKIWKVLRIPFREVKFLLRKRGNVDPLIESLFQFKK